MKTEKHNIYQFSESPILTINVGLGLLIKVQTGIHCSELVSCTQYTNHSVQNLS